MMASQPVALETNRILEAVQYVLNHHAPPSTLVICSSKAAFLQAVRGAEETPANRQDATAQPVTTALQTIWQRPTLRLLSTSRTLKLAFCPDITHLRAYLSTYSISAPKRASETDTALRSKDVLPILAILNPIQLHRDTSAFSAQGLNRTFSVAVEAAHHTGSKLVITECHPPTSGDDASITDDTSIERSGEPPGSDDPWDEEISILNVTTRRLGELSVGRTVKARAVAERWCTFEVPPQSG